MPARVYTGSEIRSWHGGFYLKHAHASEADVYDDVEDLGSLVQQKHVDSTGRAPRLTVIGATDRLLLKRRVTNNASITMDPMASGCKMLSLW